MNKRIINFFAILIFSIFATTGFATDCYWTGDAQDGDLENSANWDNGDIPDSGDRVYFSSDYNYDGYSWPYTGSINFYYCEVSDGDVFILGGSYYAYKGGYMDVYGGDIFGGEFNTPISFYAYESNYEYSKIGYYSQPEFNDIVEIFSITDWYSGIADQGIYLNADMFNIVGYDWDSYNGGPIDIYFVSGGDWNYPANITFHPDSYWCGDIICQCYGNDRLKIIGAWDEWSSGDKPIFYGEVLFEEDYSYTMVTLNGNLVYDNEIVAGNYGYLLLGSGDFEGGIKIDGASGVSILNSENTNKYDITFVSGGDWNYPANITFHPDSYWCGDIICQWDGNDRLEIIGEWSSGDKPIFYGEVLFEEHSYTMVTLNGNLVYDNEIVAGNYGYLLLGSGDFEGGIKIDGASGVGILNSENTNKYDITFVSGEGWQGNGSPVHLTSDYYAYWCGDIILTNTENFVPIRIDAYEYSGDHDFSGEIKFAAPWQTIILCEQINYTYTNDLLITNNGYCYLAGGNFTSFTNNIICSTGTIVYAFDYTNKMFDIILDDSESYLKFCEEGFDLYNLMENNTVLGIRNLFIKNDTTTNLYIDEYCQTHTLSSPFVHILGTLHVTTNLQPNGLIISDPTITFYDIAVYSNGELFVDYPGFSSEQYTIGDVSLSPTQVFDKITVSSNSSLYVTAGKETTSEDKFDFPFGYGHTKTQTNIVVDGEVHLYNGGIAGGIYNGSVYVGNTVQTHSIFDVLIGMPTSNTLAYAPVFNSNIVINCGNTIISNYPTIKWAESTYFTNISALYMPAVYNGTIIMNDYIFTNGPSMKASYLFNFGQQSDFSGLTGFKFHNSDLLGAGGGGGGINGSEILGMQ